MTTPEQASYDNKIAVATANMRMDTQPYLAKLDDFLQGAEEPMPAIGVSLHSIPGTDLPELFVGYGTTEPGEGLKPIFEVSRDDGRGGRRVKYGLALPMNRASQGSATFFPHEDDSEENSQPSPTTGRWQQWRRDRFTLHQPGKKPYIREYPDGDVGFTDRPFSTWYIPAAPNMPFIVASADLAREEASQGLAVVLRRRISAQFVAVSQEAVQAVLDTLQEQPAGKPDLLKPMLHMLGTITTDLGIQAATQE